MAYKDIVVYLDPTPDTESRLKLAIAMAHAHGARLIGVDASTEAAFEGEWRDRTMALQDRFEEAIRLKGVSGVFHSEVGSHNSDLHPDAHCSDLIIASQSSFEARDLVAKAIPEDILLTAGVPVLLLPYDWNYHDIGRKVVIAWNGSREATRAVHDALPILGKAEKVTIFTYAFKSRPEREQQRLIDHLQRHGVAAAASVWHSERDISPIEALLKSPATADADLIVAGAYGKPPAVEKWLDGPSYELSTLSQIPIFMSH